MLRDSFIQFWFFFFFNNNTDISCSMSLIKIIILHSVLTKNIMKFRKQRDKRLSVPWESHCSRRTSSLLCFNFLFVYEKKKKPKIWQSERTETTKCHKKIFKNFLGKQTEWRRIVKFTLFFLVRSLGREAGAGEVAIESAIGKICEKQRNWNWNWNFGKNPNLKNIWERRERERIEK